MADKTAHYTFVNESYTRVEPGEAVHHLDVGIYTDLVILLLGLMGNSLTIAIVVINETMHTVTNYYLLTLAVADLLLLIDSVVWDITQRYFMFFELCYAFHWIEYTSIYVSIITITTFTIERYHAIIRPFRQLDNAKSRVVKSIVAIWSIAILSGYLKARYLRWNEALQDCTFTISEVFILFNVYACVFFVMPLAIMVVLYTLIGITLKRREKEFQNSGFNRACARSIKLLLTVVVVFFVCWTWYFLGTLFNVYTNYFSNLNSSSMKLYMKAHFVTSYFQDFTFLLSTVANPIIYSIVSRKFRRAYKQVLYKMCNRHDDEDFDWDFGETTTGMNGIAETCNVDVTKHF